jgi:hypothetical protein
MTLLLMAAGSGSRYGKLKQFDELGPKDEFLMEFSIFENVHGTRRQGAPVLVPDLACNLCFLLVKCTLDSRRSKA